MSCTLCLGAAMASPAVAADLTPDQQEQLLIEGLQAFDRGTQLRKSRPEEALQAFQQSADKFQFLVDAGIANGKLFYNLGNAYLRCGDLGKAIVNYRRAEKLRPTDGQVEANLGFARSLRRNQIASSAQRTLWHSLFAWHFNTSLGTRFAIGLGFYVLFWLALILRQYVRAVRWRFVLVPSLLIWLSLGVSIAFERYAETTHPEGVVLADDVTVRKGNGEGFELQFEQSLEPGDEFTLLEKRRDWIHIQLPDGADGWIRLNQAELI